MKHSLKKALAIVLAVMFVFAPLNNVFALVKVTEAAGSSENDPVTDEYIAVWGGHTYQLVRSSKTWDDAGYSCGEIEGFLAEIESYEEWEVIRELIERSKNDSRFEDNGGKFWVGGLRTSDGWVWSGELDYGDDDDDEGSSVGQWEFSAWKENEPSDNVDSNRARMIVESDGWSAADRDETHYYIFETYYTPEFVDCFTWNDSTYQFMYIDRGICYEDIVQFCEYLGGKPLTIDSAEEDAEVQSMIEDVKASEFVKNYNWGDGFVYNIVLGIDGSSGSSKLYGGSDIVYSNWAENNPEDGEVFAVICEADGYKWKHVSYDDTYSYLFVVERNTELVAQHDLDGHTYYCYSSGLDWNAAKEFCERNGGHLATVSYEEEWNGIMHIIPDGQGRQYWLGATDEENEGQWKWITGEDFNYTLWANGEPNNTENPNGSENWLCTYDNSWNDNFDTNCGYEAVDGFIMEVEHTNDLASYSWNGHNYIFVEVCNNETYDYDQIAAYCDNRGDGHLVTIESRDENAAVDGFTQDFVLNRLGWGTENQHDWQIALGCTDRDNEGEWKWLGEWNVEFTNWRYNEPDNSSGEENNPQNYCVMVGYDGGVWDDVEKLEESIFIMESEEPLRLTNAICGSGEWVDVNLVASWETELNAITIRYINYDDSALELDWDNIEVVQNADDLLTMNIKSDGSIVIVFNNVDTFEGDVVRFHFKAKDSDILLNYYSFTADLGYSDEEENIHEEHIDSVIQVRNYEVGDLNLDGKVTVSDAVCLLWALMDEGKYQIPEGMDCDFDYNGYLNLSDAVQLLWHIFYPEEFEINYDNMFMMVI